LRRVSNYYTVTKELNETGYAVLKTEVTSLNPDDDFSNIMGLYTSKGKLKSAVETKVKTFDLCPKLAGLENGKGACFWYQLGKCRGACVGKESPHVYNQRLELAMSRSRLENWPFKSAIALSTGQGDTLVLNNWVVTGYLKMEKGKQVLSKIEPIFSLDSYRILRSYITQHVDSVSIRPYPDPAQ
jgi:DNA polymerase-3 subunit epsilon